MLASSLVRGGLMVAGSFSCAAQVACEVDAIACARLLISFGANLEAAAPDGTRPLMVACQMGRSQVADQPHGLMGCHRPMLTSLA